ncbi:MAG: hypothetical protein JWO30_2231 [Fibrobacteres bacterium]|nr:hypothetical protein [Fibrobacterota bacterium]
MFILHESIWWLLATGAVGWYLGYLKGMARWGLLLGLIFGPIGWGIVMFLPARSRPQREFRPTGPACPQCGKSVGRSDKVCSHCGNLLIPIRYRVMAPDSRSA